MRTVNCVTYLSCCQHAPCGPIAYTVHRLLRHRTCVSALSMYSIMRAHLSGNSGRDRAFSSSSAPALMACTGTTSDSASSAPNWLSDSTSRKGWPAETLRLRHQHLFISNTTSVALGVHGAFHVHVVAWAGSYTLQGKDWKAKTSAGASDQSQGRAWEVRSAP